MSQQIATTLYTASAWVIPLVIAITSMKPRTGMSRGCVVTIPLGVSAASLSILSGISILSERFCCRGCCS